MLTSHGSYVQGNMPTEQDRRLLSQHSHASPVGEKGRESDADGATPQRTPIECQICRIGSSNEIVDSARRSSTHGRNGPATPSDAHDIYSRARDVLN